MVSSHRDKDKTTVNPSEADYKEQTPGGPRDRMDWLAYQLQKDLTGNEVKALIAYNRDSNKAGMCFSSIARLAQIANISRTQFYEARIGVIAKGCLTVPNSGKGRRTTSTHKLTGADDGWLVDSTAWERPKTATIKSRKAGLSNPEKRDLSNPEKRDTEPFPSSFPTLNPKVRGDQDGAEDGIFNPSEGRREGPGTGKRTAAKAPAPETLPAKTHVEDSAPALPPKMPDRARLQDVGDQFHPTIVVYALECFPSWKGKWKNGIKAALDYYENNWAQFKKDLNFRLKAEAERLAPAEMQDAGRAEHLARIGETLDRGNPVTEAVCDTCRTKTARYQASPSNLLFDRGSVRHIEKCRDCLDAVAV